MAQQSGITRLHHVNVLTANLPAMRDFYSTVLDLRDGWRPPFDIDGAWLYQGDTPIVHLVDRPDTADTPAGRLEHYALSGTDLPAFLSRLTENQVSFEVLDIPETTLQSVNLSDPDGNHIEVLFDSENV